MGREAVARAAVGGDTAEVRALLESREIILRGALKRRFAIPSLMHVRVEGGALCFTCAGEMVRLHLGEDVAWRWQAALIKPPPTLRAKLGLDGQARALLVGACEDAALALALDGVLTPDIGAARMIIACVQTGADLAAALAVQRAARQLPLWTVYPKGSSVPFGDRAIRETLRAAAFRDTKSCAVSDRLTATRYNPA